MSQVKIQGNASGTGVFTIAAPNSNTDRTLTLPDEAGTVLVNGTTSNVGLGVSSVAGFDSGADNLVIGSGSGNNGLTIYSGSTAVGSINFANGTSGSSIYAGGINYNHNTNAMSFYTTDGSTRARITSGGTFLIGRTTDVSATTRLGLDATASIAGFVSETGPTTSVTHGRFINGNGTVGSISTNGTSTTYSTSSDYRLKEQIQPMVGALAKVAALKPVTYKWKTDGKAGEGFIAHELQAVVPDAVVGEKDAVETYTDEDGNEQTRPVYQGIDTSFLVATLTAAIQEQQAQIEALKARLDALESPSNGGEVTQ